MINSINLVGRAGSDPNTRYFESGAILSEVSLAVSRRKKDAPPDWFSLKMWGKIAEVCGDWVRKGNLIGVTGHLEIESWSDRTTGETRTKPVVVVESLNLLGSRSDNQA